MKWPTVAILIVTYDRSQEIRRTIDALKANIHYPGDLGWHIADDHTPDDSYLPSLRTQYRDLKLTYSVTDRQGWGANVNKAMGFCLDRYSDYIFLCEDDYVSQYPIDLRQGVALLERVRNFGLVRYDGVHGHELDLLLRERATKAGKVTALILQKSSPHLNLYSNRPHLKHRRFHDYYGKYDEGKRLGETESAFAHLVKDKYADGPKIVTLMSGLPRAFKHIGKSRQLTKDDV